MSPPAQSSLPTAPPSPPPAGPHDPAAQQLLLYLQHHLTGYPFNPALDTPFVEELCSDFPDVDLLEETKAFRWYYDNQPAARLPKLRVALRRWIANAWTRRPAG